MTDWSFMSRKDRVAQTPGDRRELHRRKYATVDFNDWLHRLVSFEIENHELGTPKHQMQSVRSMYISNYVRFHVFSVLSTMTMNLWLDYLHCGDCRFYGSCAVPIDGATFNGISFQTEKMMPRFGVVSTRQSAFSDHLTCCWLPNGSMTWELLSLFDLRMSQSTVMLINVNDCWWSANLCQSTVF